MDEFRGSGTPEPNGVATSRHPAAASNGVSSEPRVVREPDLSVLRNADEEDEADDTDDTTVPERFKVQ
jgi:hypothetical protein